MIVKFKSRATADLIMTGDVAQRVLKLLGKEAGQPGIITVAQLPAAKAALQAAAAEELAALAAQGATEDADDTERKPGQGITLQQRIVPLLNMMDRCLAEQVDIVWGV